MMTKIMTAFANELAASRAIDVREAFIDASFAPDKRGLKVGRTRRGKGTKIMAVADRHGLPVSGTSPSREGIVQAQRRIDSTALLCLPWNLHHGPNAYIMIQKSGPSLPRDFVPSPMKEVSKLLPSFLFLALNES